MENICEWLLLEMIQPDPVYKLSTVLNKLSNRSEKFFISFSRPFCKFRTKEIRVFFFKSLSVFYVWAIYVW